ncbi:MAG: hypothetical protein Tsb0019_22260 [Roseibium sp.]
MAVQAESVWLGSARQPVRLVMLASLFGTLACSFLLIVGGLFSNPGFDMKQFLAPADAPLALATLILAATALLSASIYMSDRRGVIEPEPSGFFDIVSLVCARLSMLATAAIVLVMFFEVVSRYVFEKPTLWANELSLWIAGFVFLLAGLYAMQQRSHIRIYIIYDMLPRWLQKLSDVFSVLLIWAFTGLLIWGGYNEALSKFLRWETFGTAWDPPLPATIKPAILIIVLMVAIQALSNLIADWNKAPEAHLPVDEIDEHEIELMRKNIEG